jgi:hypothetical protein
MAMATSKKKAGSKKAKKRTSKRELIEPKAGNKRYVRRSKSGQFNEVDDAGSSLARDRKRKAKKKTKAGQGDKGDRPAAKASKKTRKKTKKKARKSA